MLLAGSATSLPPRWYPLKAHPEQVRLIRSPARFKVVPAGRRSGKTERAKRHIVQAALAFTAFPDGRFIAAAPTHDQAREIFWDDLRAMSPAWAVESINETRREIRYINGARVTVVGLDKPERVEGKPIDGIIVDEFANVKPDAWPKHIRPALSTLGRPGWAWLFGVPEGRGHYYELYQRARSGVDPEWDGFTWFSADIIDPAELESARASLDEDTFRQEYEAAFINYAGLMLRAWNPAVNVRKVTYDRSLPLYLGVDFNWNPMAMTVMQWHPERDHRGRTIEDRSRGEIHIIDEAWCRNSSIHDAVGTLRDQWAQHPSGWEVWPDPAGKGHNHAGYTDHALLMRALEDHGFRECRLNALASAPGIRDAVNAANALLRSGTGVSRLFVSPGCKHWIEDAEKLVWDDKGRDALKTDKDRTHAFDSSKYALWAEFRPDVFKPEPGWRPK